MDYYDKIMKTKYIISDMIDKFTIFYQKNHKNIVKKHFKDGKYGDDSLKPRRCHFLISELIFKIKIHIILMNG